MYAIGSRLKAARYHARLSLAEAARPLGYSRQAIAGWESGRTNPNAIDVAQLAVLYGVSADWLLLGFADARAPMSMRVRRLGSQLDALPDDRREQVLSTIESLVSMYAEQPPPPPADPAPTHYATQDR